MSTPDDRGCCDLLIRLWAKQVTSQSRATLSSDEPISHPRRSCCSFHLKQHPRRRPVESSRCPTRVKQQRVLPRFPSGTHSFSGSPLAHSRRPQVIIATGGDRSPVPLSV